MLTTEGNYILFIKRTVKNSRRKSKKKMSKKNNRKNRGENTKTRSGRDGKAGPITKTRHSN